MASGRTTQVLEELPHFALVQPLVCARAGCQARPWLLCAGDRSSRRTYVGRVHRPGAERVLLVRARQVAVIDGHDGRLGRAHAQGEVADGPAAEGEGLRAAAVSRPAGQWAASLDGALGSQQAATRAGSAPHSHGRSAGGPRLPDRHVVLKLDEGEAHGRVRVAAHPAVHDGAARAEHVGQLGLGDLQQAAGSGAGGGTSWRCRTGGRTWGSMSQMYTVLLVASAYLRWRAFVLLRRLPWSP